MYDSPVNERLLMEYIEGLDDCDADLIDHYIEERRYEYRYEWFEFLDELDKE